MTDSNSERPENWQKTHVKLMLANQLLGLIDDQALWSQETFGTDAVRGPIGSLKHLAKEALEAAEEAAKQQQSGWDHLQKGPTDKLAYEIADCFLLTLDAVRRSGLSLEQLMDYAGRKQAINRTRIWPKPTSSEPVEHDKSNEPMTYRCFHCREVFDEEQAAKHFGNYRTAQIPLCTVSQADYRELEARLMAYVHEDTELHKQVLATESKLQVETRRSEEAGYARGLRDARRWPEELGLQHKVETERNDYA